MKLHFKLCVVIFIQMYLFTTRAFGQCFDFKGDLCCIEVECLHECSLEVEYLSLHKLNRPELPHDFSNYPKLRIIMIGHCGYGDLPKEVFTCLNLEILNYGGDSLLGLSDRILDCKKLMSLNFTAVGLESIPKVIGKIDQLEYLCLASNRIHRIPRCIRRLPNLKELVLSNNPIADKKIARFRRQRPDVKVVCEHYDPNQPEKYLDDED